MRAGDIRLRKSPPIGARAPIWHTALLQAALRRLSRTGPCQSCTHSVYIAKVMQMLFSRLRYTPHSPSPDHQVSEHRVRLRQSNRAVSKRTAFEHAAPDRAAPQSKVSIPPSVQKIPTAANSPTKPKATTMKTDLDALPLPSAGRREIRPVGPFPFPIASPPVPAEPPAQSIGLPSQN